MCREDRERLCLDKDIAEMPSVSDGKHSMRRPLADRRYLESPVYRMYYITTTKHNLNKPSGKTRVYGNKELTLTIG